MGSKASSATLSGASVPLPRWTQPTDIPASVRLLDYAAMCAAARLARVAATEKSVVGDVLPTKA